MTEPLIALRDLRRAVAVDYALSLLLEIAELAGNLVYAPAEDERDHETPLLNALERIDWGCRCDS